MKNVYLVITLIIVILRLGGYFSIAKLSDTNQILDVAIQQPLEQQFSNNEVENSQPLKITADVPFTSQAPQDQWHDDRYQNACEEASVIMAMSWVKGVSLNPEIATKQIAELTKFQQDNYGHHHDRSAEDVTQLIKDYYKYENVEFKTNIGIEDIIEELAKGYIVITPLNGQKLKNPYYNPPGPIEHMAVVIGYDKQNNEFMLNDPGTKRGNSYRYATSILEDALRDYPTGYHEPIAEVNKSMIVVKPPHNL